MNESTHPLIANQRTVRAIRKVAADEAKSAIAASKQLATVTTAKPFTIKLDGASKSVPAHYLSTYTPVKGDRVFIETYSRQFWVLGEFDHTVIPASIVKGSIFESVGDGSGDGIWVPPASTTYQYTRSYPVIGPLVDYTFPGFAVSVQSGTKTDLIAVEAVLSAGTGTVEITQQPFGGTPAGVTGLTSIAVTTTDSGYLTPSTTPSPVADQDRFAFVLSGSAGTGDIVIDYVFETTKL